MSNISDMIAAAKQSRTVNSMPSQILPIFVAVNEALMTSTARRKTGRKHPERPEHIDLPEYRNNAGLRCCDPASQRDSRSMPRLLNSTVPTLAELREHSAWTWVYCERVLASRARRFRAAHDPLGRRRIKRQAEALRHVHRCGHKGATLQHPGWVDAVVGFQPFPG